MVNNIGEYIMSKQDPAKIYYAEFKDKTVMLRNMEKRLIRKFLMKSKVIDAQVSGYGDNSQVAIVMEDGKTYVYSSSGRLIRR